MLVIAVAIVNFPFLKSYDTHVHNCPNLDVFVDVVGAVCSDRDMPKLSRWRLRQGHTINKCSGANIFHDSGNKHVESVLTF